MNRFQKFEDIDTSGEQPLPRPPASTTVTVLDFGPQLPDVVPQRPEHTAVPARWLDFEEDTAHFVALVLKYRRERAEFVLKHGNDPVKIETDAVSAREMVERENKMRLVDARAVKILYDSGREEGPERSEWLRETGRKPQQLALNAGVEANEVLTRSRGRFRESLSAAADEIPAQQTTTTPQFVYIAGCGGQAALPCGHLSDLMNPGVTLVLFSVDFWEALSRDQRYQIIKIP